MTTEENIGAAAAQARIGELRADKEFATRFAQGGRAELEEFTRLHKAAYGEGGQPQAEPTPPEAGAPTEGENPADDLAELDAAFPAGKAGEFKLPKFLPDDQPATAKAMEFDQKARGWLVAAEFPAGIGSAVAAEVAKVDGEWSAMNETQRELYGRKQLANLRRLWGDATGARVDLARRFVQEIEAKTPGIVEALEVTGAGNSAFVIGQIAMQAERYYAKRGAKR